MTLSVSGLVMKNESISNPFRLIVSGSIETGKTTLIKNMLRNFLLFKPNITKLYYYYPDYSLVRPDKWSELDISITYCTGLPSLNNMKHIVENSCVIIEDQYYEAIANKDINDLFCTYARKYNISLIISTPDYFADGLYARSIRNSCNYLALFNNFVHVSTNSRICKQFGLLHAYNKAKQVNATNMFGFYFIDNTVKSQLSDYRLFVNLGDWNVQCFSNYGPNMFAISHKVLSRHYLSYCTSMEVTAIDIEYIDIKPLPTTRSDNKIFLFNECNFIKISKKHNYILPPTHHPWKSKHMTRKRCCDDDHLLSEKDNKYQTICSSCSSGVCMNHSILLCRKCC